MKVPPHLLYQAAHKGRVRLLGGCPPPLLRAEGCPPPVLACCALGAHAAQRVSPTRWPRLPPLPPSPACRALGVHADRGVPLWLPRGSPTPPLTCMPCAGSACCLGGSTSPSSWLGESPPSLPGMPCAGSKRCRSGGSLPLSGLVPRIVGARDLSPALSCLRTVCACCWGWGPPSGSCSLPRRGVPCCCVWGYPPVPLLRATGTRCWVGVTLSLSLLGGRSR